MSYVLTVRDVSETVSFVSIPQVFREYVLPDDTGSKRTKTVPADP